MFRESHSKDALYQSKLCEIAMQRQENILASLARIFSWWNSFYKSLDACFNFNLNIVCTSHCTRKKTIVF